MKGKRTTMNKEKYSRKFASEWEFMDFFEECREFIDWDSVELKWCWKEEDEE
jgi:hypothetical protein